MSLAPASAAPASSSALKHMAAQDGPVVQTQYAPSRKAYRKGYRKGHRHGYRAGHRYRHAPRGWKRYGSRPYGWQSRGCVIVGPVWFCP